MAPASERTAKWPSSRRSNRLSKILVNKHGKEPQVKLQKLKFGTPPSKGKWKPSFETILYIVIAGILMTLFGCSTNPSRVNQVGPDATVVIACPELSPLSDNSFGATTAKLSEVGGIYRECRKAALAGATK